MSKRKIYISIIAFLIIMVMTTVVNAVQTKEPPEEFDWKGDGKGETATTVIDGWWILCIEKGGALRTTTYTGPEKESGWICNDSKPSGYWTGVRYQTHFTKKDVDAEIDLTKYQDAIYALATTTDIDEAQRILWALDINEGRPVSYSSDLWKEAVAYRQFYEKVQKAGGYKPQDTTNYNNVNIYADPQSGTCTAGPFSIAYLDDNFNNYKVRFGEMVDLKVRNEKDEELTVVDIMDKNGNSILTRTIHNDYHYPTSNEEFYVKYKANTTTGNDVGKYITINTLYRYLKECTGTLYEYEGKIYQWKWSTSGSQYHPTDFDKFGNPVNGHTDRKYKLNRSGGSTAQSLVAYSQDANKVWDTATLTMKAIIPNKATPPTTPTTPTTPDGVDITMNLAGCVFLDKDTGKINAGNNIKDGDELLKGVQVTLYEVGSTTPVTLSTAHKHEGNSITGTGCFKAPVYHTHTEDCYHGKTHTHIGNSITGGGCYQTPVYHIHEDDCRELTCVKQNHTHNNSCYDQYGNKACKIEEHTHNDGDNCYGKYQCGKIECTYNDDGTVNQLGSIEYYRLSCKEEVKDILVCNKVEGKDIEYYVPACNVDYSTPSSSGYVKVQNPVITGSDGYYKFEGLDPMKKYYVRFTYNGMLYTNVQEVDPLVDNSNTNASRASENGHTYNFTQANKTSSNAPTRQPFNNMFSEIGSYPTNYYSQSRGAYNQVFLQEDIVDTFNSIMQNFGTHGNTDKEVYAYDCRISSYTERQYPLYDKFVVDSEDLYLYGKHDEQHTYYGLYKTGGKADQLNVNLGIKARPVFDLALYKDVLNATISINGKQELYTYDARKDWQNKGFSYGVNEDYYIGQLRDKYMQNIDTNITTKESLDEGRYIHEFRTEEIINGNNTNNSYKSWLQDNNNYEKTLYGSDYNPNGDKKYAWRDINQVTQLSDSDKLQIHVTYKIAIRNQSGIVGSATEIVDYYDSKYNFEDAYVGDADGNRTGTVTTNTTSKYGEVSRVASANGTWNVQTAEQQYGGALKGTPHEYKTIYLQPDEQKLGDGETQYIYVKFVLNNPEDTLIKAGVQLGEKLYTYNMAEINGYKTYGYKDKNITASEGLIDKDSIAGNFNPSTYNYGDGLEDDTSRAPAYAYSIRASRTLEGNVFEDMLSNNATASEYKNDEYKVVANKTRFGDGTINAHNVADKMIAGVKVELIEIKDGKLYTRQTTKTNSNGWYGFGAFLPGNYTIRFTYGSDDDTALITNSGYAQGKNDTSYNGQDYQSTIYTLSGNNINTQSYATDDTLKRLYADNNNAKESEENIVNVDNTQNILKYEPTNYYWYADNSINGKSDAKDYETRRDQVTQYSKGEYGREITNHKGEVFNSYINQAELRNDVNNNRINPFTQAYPMDEGVDNKEKNRALVNELERRTYMYAYTPEIPVEVEYTTTQITGNQTSDYYTHKITGVDFGVVERPRVNLAIDQDIEYIKVTASNGDTLLELQYDELAKHYKVIVDNENNYQWIEKEQQNDTFEGYDKNELLNIIMDDELLSGSKLEVRYRFTVTNNSEVCTNIANTLNTGNTSRAKNIINYVANNLNFDASDNNELWEVVNKDDIQKASNSTLINNDVRSDNTKVVDLSTQTTILKATDKNTLTKQLKPGESATEILTLKKILSSESSSDDLKYTNMAEIVEVESELGRRDYGAIPGNQSLEEQPREHDAAGASRYDEMANSPYDPDGKIIITPPTGESKIYYVLAATIAVIVLASVVLIKKFVLGGKE